MAKQLQGVGLSVLSKLVLVVHMYKQDGRIDICQSVTKSGIKSIVEEYSIEVHMKTLAVNRIQVWLFKKLMKFATRLQQIPLRVTPPPFRMIQIGSMFWQSRALYVATRLGVADELGDKQKSIAEIADHLKLNRDYLYRLVRMLGSLGIFEEIAPGIFRNSRLSHYMRKDNPENMRDMILMHNSTEMSQPWFESLENAMKTGVVPFVESHGEDLFEYMDHHKEFDLLFSRAMDSVENLTGNEYLKDFNWSAFERVIDVGGSKGKKSIAILQENPGLTATVFDRPQIIEAASTYWQDKTPGDVISRIRFQPGNMFESIPAAESGKDLYLFFAIFHGLDDDESKQVLTCLKKAVGDKNPYILIGDAVAEECGIDPSIASFDMQMLIGTRGRERTLPEWRSLFENSGFRIQEVIDVRTFIKFIVVRPVM